MNQQYFIYFKKENYDIIVNLMNEVQSIYYGDLVRIYSESIVGVRSPPLYPHYIKTRIILIYYSI